MRGLPSDEDNEFFGIFIEEWINCMEEFAEKGQEEGIDAIELIKCFNIGTMLKRCLRADPDYCVPLLEAEKAARKEEGATRKEKLEEAEESEEDTEESAPVVGEVSDEEGDD